ncbi:hypothetical protein IWW34DRAFT_153597 [Fusarium oxysporum f. sp. albedinis]|nr:hypothetical protein IWW34DRAFT_153597 [Fusarium oxysporum f. sp. albedinis]
MWVHYSEYFRPRGRPRICLAALSLTLFSVLVISDPSHIPSEGILQDNVAFHSPKPDTSGLHIDCNRSRKMSNDMLMLNSPCAITLCNLQA